MFIQKKERNSDSLIPSGQREKTLNREYANYGPYFRIFTLFFYPLLLSYPNITYRTKATKDGVNVQQRCCLSFVIDLCHPNGGKKKRMDIFVYRAFCVSLCVTQVKILVITSRVVPPEK